MAVLKTECPKELKKRFKDLSKAKGETESAILRKAVLIYMNSQEREYKPIKDYGGRP
jgi:predicted DNA-binding protein